MTGKDKATISVSIKSRIAKLLQTKSASDFDGTNSPPRERILKYASLAMSTSPEAVVQRCSVKKVFLEISQNSQENTCARVSF